MRRAAERHGPEAVAVTLSSGSTTAIADSAGFIRRLANAFGTPNAAITLDVCGWGRAFATRYTYGVGSVGAGGGAMPDIENSGCLILWGYNPSSTRLTHATAIVKALKRGMRLIVIDPRHAGLANKADVWLRVRPGTDGAPALGLAHLMLDRGWYDRDFIRSWSDGLLLVRAYTGRLLTERDLEPTDDSRRNLAWDTATWHLVPYDASTGRYDGDSASLALEGEYRIPTPQGEVPPRLRALREALSALEFYAHADLFMRPTAELADVVLPVASSFEREALKIGFEISEEVQSLIQLGPAVVPPPGEARPDTDIIFDLAARLGLAEQFWNADIDAAYRHQLAPTGITLEQLRATPGGVRVQLQTRHAKYAEPGPSGAPRGFATPSRKVEFYSQTFLDHGYAPLPDFAEPQIGPVARPDLAVRFPLVLTSAKPTLFCQTQHRALPSLRKRALHPEVELHPAAAQVRGVANGDWVSIETPEGRVRARARLNDSLDLDVVVGEHGWWQACAEIGAPGYDPFGPGGANLNLIIGTTVLDPVSGTASHRSYLCEIRRAPEAV
jgi:anaerobic selenocysteine-containing dehydrogenase